jgi:acetolactate synthase-1/2/3 large subunit
MLLPSKHIRGSSGSPKLTISSDWKVLKIVREELPKDAIVTTGVGGHQMWAALHYPVYKPGTYLTSGGLGTMGYGFPAAIGAKAAAPDKPVLDIDGDGSFLMTSQNLATVKQYGLNVGVLVFDNGSLQLIRQWQDLFFGHRRVGENLAYLPDFVKLANSFGIEGVRPENYDEMRKAIRRVAQGEALVIDYIVDPDIMVLPMIAPGKVIAPENIILTPEQAAGIVV